MLSHSFQLPYIHMHTVRFCYNVWHLLEHSMVVAALKHFSPHTQTHMCIVQPHKTNAQHNSRMRAARWWFLHMINTCVCVFVFFPCVCDDDSTATVTVLNGGVCVFNILLFLFFYAFGFACIGLQYMIGYSPFPSLLNSIFFSSIQFTRLFFSHGDLFFSSILLLAQLAQLIRSTA